MELTKSDYKKIHQFQKDEITECRIYEKLSKRVKDENNKQVLSDIADDEKKHYDFWEDVSGKKISPNYFKVYLFYFISVVFGLVFGIKLLEKGEEQAQDVYGDITNKIEGVKEIISDEYDHESKLIAMIDDDRLNYVGSVVLGLNDALVELTGTLAGLTFALRNTNLIAISGLITGIAASFSMAASEYLAKKSDGDEDALKSSLYTGLAYIVTVTLLVLPYLLISQYFISLIVTLAVAVLVIVFFNFYIAIAKDLSFKKRFLEMFAISMGVAVFSFLVGYLVRIFFGVDI
ncbi:VIT1/CCC1 transporter family protein [Geotoga petraea]|jgi:VIT1/CCC1 family predicted Fe2+/Mn2+ transporter|uniref:Predicted Fe2+/Mn2+ transporter, VIT1/CCC1 family n=1 Tax=Geotoga petraea TaxID=28234 RepID=A0A1G6KW18_9BACT|nr:VIT1/CCC1 transporter family protein [Geotoga petraea]TGG88743.1 rubrerythrin family protein [Geotoga petraea]SDC34665.1 Predicted Fe2+/Mn2+ transporter, VIT1/CCC1 family [Geotoga petraea]